MIMTREHKIKNDFGMVDYYKYHKGTCSTPTSRKVFNDVISDFNLELQQLIIEEGLTYQMPGLYLELMLKKAKRKPRIENGKLVNNLPINWKATNALWAKDAEAKEKKILIKFSNGHTGNYVFRIYCKKFKSRLKLRNIYKFEGVRDFKRAISKAIFDENKNVDAFLLHE